MTTVGAEPLRRNRSFRRFLAGQFVTNAGDSLYTVAVLWLVFELSGSTVLTGIASAILLLPWLLQILAGPIVDRLPLKRLLVGSQLVQGVVVLVLPLAAVTGRLTVGVLFAVIPVLMLATLVMSPMQSVVVPRIVDDGQLSRANSLLATVTLGLDMVFDALGGVFIALAGTTALFLVDAVTFALAALLFAGLGLRGTDDRPQAGDRTRTDAHRRTESDGESDDSTADSSEDSVPSEGPDPSDDTSSGDSPFRAYVADVRTGIDVLRGTVFVELIALTAIANFATGVTLAILPSFGSSLGGPAVYGLLLGALGIGRLVGSIVAPYVESVRYGRLTLATYAAGTCCWLGAVFAPSPALTVLLFGLAWIPAGIAGVLTATLNQTVFPTELLGRVSATKGTASGATLPLGSLVGGVVAELLGTSTTMALAAAGFGATALAFLVRARLRRLPTVATATAADFDVIVGGPTDAGANADGEGAPDENAGDDTEHSPRGP